MSAGCYNRKQKCWPDTKNVIEFLVTKCWLDIEMITGWTPKL